MTHPPAPSGERSEADRLIEREFGMVEQVARALFLAEHPAAEWNGGRARSIWFSRAYAALRAMREPSDAMLAAARPEPVHLYGEGGRGEDYQRQMRAACEVDRLVARQLWQDMIDAALAWPTADDVARAALIAGESPA